MCNAADDAFPFNHHTIKPATKLYKPVKPHSHI